MCTDTEDWCKIWREIDLPFQNWHEEFDEFWPEHSKDSKICTLMDSFWPTYVMFKLKKYGGSLRESNKKQRGGRIILNFTKEETFVETQCGPPSYTL